MAHELHSQPSRRARHYSGDRSPANARTCGGFREVAHGRVAAEAGAAKLVLSHFVPAEDAMITEQTWRDAVATHYSGPIVLGSDLLSIDLD